MCSPEQKKIKHWRSPQHRNNLLSGIWICRLGWQPPRQSTKLLRYICPPKLGHFTCVNPALIAWMCLMTLELEECVGLTAVYCILLSVLISIPSLRSSVSDKPTCKKTQQKFQDIVPFLAGIQVRNVPTYLEFDRAKMSVHGFKILHLQYFKSYCTSLSISFP